MKVRRWRGLLALPVALVTTLTPSAAQATSACSQLGGTISEGGIRLLNSGTTDGRGLRTHGIGVQMTIEIPPWPAWSFASAGNGTVVIEDPSQNCLRMAHTDQATTANGCNRTSNYQRWLPVDASTSTAIACEFVNLQNDGYLKTNGNQEGDNVWVGPNTSGSYIKWKLY